jgi:hypothetical protein
MVNPKGYPGLLLTQVNPTSFFYIVPPKSRHGLHSLLIEVPVLLSAIVFYVFQFCYHLYISERQEFTSSNSFDRSTISICTVVKKLYTVQTHFLAVLHVPQVLP